MEQVQRLIGVDFGTSTSLVRVKRYQGDKPIGDSYHAASVTYGNGAGDSKAVTVVRVNEDQTVTCGRYGEEETPGSTVYREFKMDLEREDPGKKQKAQELTTRFFEYLYERYRHQTADLGSMDDRERTLISYPAKWKPETVEFMEKTAIQAGFPEVTSMDEPTAALYAVLCRRMNALYQQKLLRINDTGYVLLIDMGAGTTDLAVCGYRVNPDYMGDPSEKLKTMLISTWPTDRSELTFGGREVDRILEDYVVNYLHSCGFAPEMAANLVKGKPNVKLWKEDTVSNLLARNHPVNTCSFTAPYTAIFGQSKPFPAFGRQEFQLMLHEKLEEFCQLVRDCLDDAMMAAPEIWDKGIDLVVLTGGHSSWYFTGELLDGTMPGLMHPALEAIHQQKERVLRLSNPQETVALGLVYSQLPFHVKKLDDSDVAACTDRDSEADEETEKESGSLYIDNGNGLYNVGGNIPQPEDSELVQQIKRLIASFDCRMIPGCQIPINPKQYANLNVPQNANPLISFGSTLRDAVKNASFKKLFNTNKGGIVIAEPGIYYRCNNDIPQFCSWERFARGTLELYSSPDSAQLVEGNTAITLGCFDTYNAQARLFLSQLQEVVRNTMPQFAQNLPSKYPFETAVAQCLKDLDSEKLTQLSRNANPHQLATGLYVPVSERILFAHNSSSAGTAKYGLVITGRGIYYTGLMENCMFTPWEDFARGDPRLSGGSLMITLDGIEKKIGEVSISDGQMMPFRKEWFEALCAAVTG